MNTLTHVGNLFAFIGGLGMFLYGMDIMASGPVSYTHLNEKTKPADVTLYISEETEDQTIRSFLLRLK